MSIDMDSKTYLKRLDELGPVGCQEPYCFYKHLLQTMHPDMFMMIQIECLQRFRLEENQLECRNCEKCKGCGMFEGNKCEHDIGGNETGLRWVTNGFAKKFREVYDENLTVKEIYRRCREGDPGEGHY